MVEKTSLQTTAENSQGRDRWFITVATRTAWLLTYEKHVRISDDDEHR